MERNNRSVSQPSVVMKEFRVSIKSGIGDIFEHENGKRKFVEIIFSKYIYSYF